jgi:hypothetical protein
VIDVRGATLKVPQTSNFYPDLPPDTIIPARGFGVSLGAHAFPIALGTRRIGIGVDVLLTRATATTPPASTAPGSGDPPATNVQPPDVAVSMRVVAPQISINFGTAHGWSYLSAGAGPARVESTAGSETVVRSKVSVNAGAGARWFVTGHLGVGFDLRGHWVGSRALFAAAAGFSLK